VNTKQFNEKMKRGMTLVEVMLGMAILGIMSVLVIKALFYPRFLAVSSTLKQMAVHAGTSEIERLRSDYTYDNMPASMTPNLSADFNLKGRSLSAVDTVETVSASGYGLGYANYEYKLITVVVSYGTMNLTLISYRSP
jgi:prepilin-type N-terminal cleavage/methylation domain-containing protein